MSFVPMLLAALIGPPSPSAGPNGPSAFSQPIAPVASVRMKRVRLATGVELQVAESGAVDGEPVLFLHGFPDSWFSYTRVLEHLPSTVRAIVPSLRGHGDSERPACCYRIADFAADAVALLDALGIRRAHVVGHSMGSFIAQRLAAQWPDRVNKLVLIGSGTTGATPPLSTFSADVQKLTDPIPHELVRDFQVSTVVRPVPSSFMETVIRESEKVPARVWRAAIAGLVAADGQSALQRVQAATLIFWGDQDGLFGRADQEKLQRSIASARLMQYNGIGHAPHWEEPERFVADLREFLRLKK